jgi:hypothetical protein
MEPVLCLLCYELLTFSILQLSSAGTQAPIPHVPTACAAPNNVNEGKVSGPDLFLGITPSVREQAAVQWLHNLLLPSLSVGCLLVTPLSVKPRLLESF